MSSSEKVDVLKGFLDKPATRDRLVRLAGRMLSKDEAEDAAHDGIVQALSAANGFRADAQVSTWMHRIVVNASLMRIRKARRAQSHLEEGQRAMPDAAWLSGVDDRPLPGDELGRRQDLARLRQAVRALPEGYREVVERCVLAEQAPEQAAAALGISPSGIRTRLGRARRQLATALGAAPPPDNAEAPAQAQAA